MEPTIKSDFSELAKPFISYSRSYSEKIKPCLITKDDLKKLYRLLAKKADEAAEIELKSLLNLPDKTKEIFEKLKGKLWVQIWGENNEYISGDHESIFDDQRLPKKILRIHFNGYNGYQIITQARMHNWFELEFDFKKNEIFNFSKVTDPINKNKSYFTTQGDNETWVDGVYQAINSFLKDKKLKRGWLHSDYTYDALLYLLFFPITFRAAYKIGLSLHLSNLTTPLSVAIYIYLFIIFLYIFRTLFNYAKWVFPVVELENASSAFHRAILGVITFGIISSAIYDLGKILSQLLF